MLFNSYEFIFLFLPVAVIIYFTLVKYQLLQAGIWWLVLISLFFYGYWDINYVPLLLLSIIFNYLVGQSIEKKPRRSILTVGIIGDLLLLGYYKYLGFFITTYNEASGYHLNVPEIILPLGISFFTFTQIAYLVEAYRGETKNYSFITYCLFVTIFPHLIAGPILNHKQMVEQFINPKNFSIDYKNLSLGYSLFIMGLFKKVVIADNIAPFVNIVFSHTADLTFMEAWIGAIGYTLQLYFDFSGYSEMALGLAMMFNFKFPVNFNSPYKAKSIIEFWRRWHITLSLYLRNYLYIPLGGNRKGNFRQLANLFVTMFIGGIWHGAGWTFIIWGSLHGLYLMVNHQWRRLNIKIPNIFCWSITFLAVVIAWVFFRAASVSDGFVIVKTMFDFSNVALPGGGSWEKYIGKLGLDSGIHFVQWGERVHIGRAILFLTAAFTLAVFFKNPQELLTKFKPDYKYAVVVFILSIIALMFMNDASEFLYFQF